MISQEEFVKRASDTSLKENVILPMAHPDYAKKIYEEITRRDMVLVDVSKSREQEEKWKTVQELSKRLKEDIINDEKTLREWNWTEGQYGKVCGRIEKSKQILEELRRLIGE